MGYAGRASVKSEQVSSGRDGSPGDSGTVLVGNPTGVIAEVADIAAIAVEGENTDETDG
jgi:hypothetical protein